ncbi:MAG TPA: AtpZ/AtpI family protein [Syntrophorhabdus sp.]|nr:AtpZ/AtpI family protein [Syntrophorhabdus sp.]MDI9558393.1 AtpZ/AtpI family protein [Pseudomonadota bacterium]MBP8744138.1 AtpZ/AtpI family protein [Syntrophorhabdus sp.]HNY71508.1 AtpZ/AtpI family protein [Syntrophorhabdus sp.]HOH27716.1 AtpZ/AtpI family protein [Syntrophorhabdus sp.]
MATSSILRDAERMSEDYLSKKIGKKEARKLKARSERRYSALVKGLRMTGLVGWTVATPTLIGVAIGKWLDRAWPANFSWTLTLLMAGLILGCFHAWYWLKRESKND